MPSGPVGPDLGQPIKVEDYLTDDHYTVRAELAGIDPGKDVEVTVGSGYLNIHAERYDQTEGKHRSEFRYGSFTQEDRGQGSQVRPLAVGPRFSADRIVPAVRSRVRACGHDEPLRLVAQLRDILAKYPSQPMSAPGTGPWSLAGRRRLP